MFPFETVLRSHLLCNWHDPTSHISCVWAFPATLHYPKQSEWVVHDRRKKKLRCDKRVHRSRFPCLVGQNSCRCLSRVSTRIQKGRKVWHVLAFLAEPLAPKPTRHHPHERQVLWSQYFLSASPPHIFHLRMLNAGLSSLSHPSWNRST